MGGKGVGTRPEVRQRGMEEGGRMEWVVLGGRMVRI